MKGLSLEIKNLKLWKVFNSRLEPTVAASINGNTSKAPSGASTGSHEAEAFVPESLRKLEKELKEKFEGKKLKQEEFDKELERFDGTKKFSKIGSASIALSQAFKKAEGFKKSNVFPYPVSNIVGGGEHGGKTSIQEFLVIPTNAERFPEAVETNASIYREFKERYSSKMMGKNDEGALVTRMDDEEVIKKLNKVAKEHNAKIGLDIAANELWDGQKYEYKSLNMDIKPKDQLKFVKKLVEEYDLFYVEDPFHEDDFRSFQLLRRETDCLVVGDDLFVTDKARLSRGIENGSGNSIIIKPNQAGTVSKTKQTFDKAEKNGFKPIISHRSGETCDPFISYLALGWGAPMLKVGIADIRIAKLNPLIKEWKKLEEEGKNPRMAEL
ncbi:MAG: enolase [Candidatus Nanohaloarchaeota archaeon QJJ-9]|nr:enolase [Candidatus Nanohaloarchaeota archaeon QJJ-9]